MSPSDAMRGRRRLRRREEPVSVVLPALLLTLLLVAACGSPVATPTAGLTPAPATETPGPTAGEDLGELYAEINRQVQALRGLAEQQPVEPRMVSADELAQILRTVVLDETPPELLSATERLYKGLGLLAPDASLADVYLDLLESQVGGLYRPETKELFVLSKAGTVGPLERLLYAHEYQHALQDQHFDLAALQEGLEDQTDLLLARHALIEGDAYTLMTRWMLEHLSADEIREVLEAGNDPEALEALERIPPIVQVQILFPARDGLQWIFGVHAEGGWEAVDEVWARPPTSTEQVLHREKYDAGEGPVAVALPEDLAARMGTGWRVGLEDTMGELQLRVWLTEGLDRARDADAAAAGWGGDRIALLDGPDGAWAIALLSEWDSAGEATEFAEAAEASLVAIGAEGTVVHRPGGTHVAVLLGSDATVAQALERTVGAPGS